MVSVYWVILHRDLLVIFALFLGVGLGLWQGYELGKEHRLKRDERGRFVKL